MVQLIQNLADEFADFAQGMVRGNPLLRMNIRKHPALILRPSAHPQSSRRIRGETESPLLRSGEVFQQTAKAWYACGGAKNGRADYESWSSVSDRSRFASEVVQVRATKTEVLFQHI